MNMVPYENEDDWPIFNYHSLFQQMQKHQIARFSQKYMDILLLSFQSILAVSNRYSPQFQRLKNLKLQFMIPKRKYTKGKITYKQDVSQQYGNNSHDPINQINQINNALQGINSDKIVGLDRQKGEYFIKFSPSPHPQYFFELANDIVNITKIIFRQQTQASPINFFSILNEKVSPTVNIQKNSEGIQNFERIVKQMMNEDKNLHFQNLAVIQLLEETEEEIQETIVQSKHKIIQKVVLKNFMFKGTNATYQMNQQGYFIDQQTPLIKIKAGDKRKTLKALKEEALNMLRMRTQSQLMHRNLATYYNKSTLRSQNNHRNNRQQPTSQDYEIYCQYYGKDNLSTFAKNKTRQFGELLEIGRQILSAYVFLSRLQKIHLDTKPENIMIQSREKGKERVKVIDYRSMITCPTDETITDRRKKDETITERRKKLTRNIYRDINNRSRIIFDQISLEDTNHRNFDLFGLSVVFDKLFSIENIAENNMSEQAKLGHEICQHFSKARVIPIRGDISIQQWLEFYMNKVRQYRCSQTVTEDELSESLSK